jgi:predicted  nucleic acid-binding Zn-ribbon protein
MKDGRALIEAGETLVFCVDEPPFPVKNNHFCILYPLMTLAGEKLDASAQSFPNRSRVWWMVREDYLKVIEPGGLWVGSLTEAKGWAATDPKSDQYEARWDTVRPDQNLIELLDVDLPEPNLSFVHENRPMAWPRRPAARVFLRGQETVVGPFRSEWNSDTMSIELKVSGGQALRLKREEFDRLAPSWTFKHTVNAFDKHHANQTYEITLVRDSKLDIAALRKHGSEIDCRSDEEIVRVAVKQAGFTRSERADLRGLLNKLDKAQLSDEIRPRLERLNLDIIASSDKAESVAAELANAPEFRGLVQEHIQAITAARVAEETARREAEINDQLDGLEKTKRKIERDIGALRKQFETKSLQQEQELKKLQEQRVKALDDRQKQLEAREQEVVAKEAQFMERIERITDRYRDQAENIGDEVLLHFPIIERLLQGRAGGGAMAPAARPGVALAEAPKPLSLNGRPRKRATRATPDEKAFLEQFQEVTRQRGFDYAAQDLINFHICVKTSMMTVLAGASGTGKSSLPRLYVEALGARQEFLQVPVRPDWLDDRDVLGAYNPIVGRFEPGVSGIVDHLIAAHLDGRDKLGGLYNVCLDEMNLARVEHYFAQALSVLENPPDQRVISLFPHGVSSSEDPYSEFRELPIGDNVRFVGTVNIDETTTFFSPKVLDRIQLVTLRSPQLDALKEGTDAADIPGIELVPLDRWLSWRTPVQAKSDARSFLVELDNILQQSKLGLHGRRFNQILRYVASANGFFDDDEALDFQVKQKVLPWLRRSTSNFDSTLEQLQELIEPTRFPLSSERLAEIAEADEEDEFVQYV